MPATEQTWRSTKRLHLVFGITAVVLLIATIWMFIDDYNREWKPIQSKFRDIEMRMTSWREFQFAANRVQAERDRLEAKLKQIRGKGLEPRLLDLFVDAAGEVDFRQFDEQRALLAELSKDSREAADELQLAMLAYDKAKLALDDANTQVVEARQAAEAAEAQVAAAAEGEQAAAQQAAADAKAAAERAEQARSRAEAAADEAAEQLAVATDASREADEAAAPVRNELVAFMEDVIQQARFEEDQASKDRKFRMADYDAAVARLGLAVRDQLDDEVIQERQAEVDEIKRDTTALTVRWEDLKRRRENLQKVYDRLTAEEKEVLDALDENEAGLDSLETAKKGLRVGFFEGPLPGKRWLELPILDAFNSPLQIENLWADGLEQKYGSFSNVRRFDRCTTCHRGMEKTLPGSPTEPAYMDQHLLKLALPTEIPEDVDLTLPEDAETQLQQDIALVSAAYGLHFAGEGLLDYDDVTVAYVSERSLGAQAAVIGPAIDRATGAQIQERQLHLDNDPQDKVAGLRVGDVIEMVNGGRITSVERLVGMLADSVSTGEPLELTVRRGLPSPYSTHPRLDLFVGSLSPHKVSDFACTICHEGQGSATEFKWASHTPNSPAERDRWIREYGWFDNHHWIYPMYPNRFIESTCLKCHHEVTDLRPSERYPDPPAPQLMHGYDLIRKYGCYGCHEINGYDGPERVGPDLRTEPNFFAAALMLQAQPSFDNLPQGLRTEIDELARHPEDRLLRHSVLEGLEVDAQLDKPALGDELRRMAVNLLKDVDNPGELRKPGPSLRYVADKIDPVFAYDWIRKPSHFRPSSRMPQFFLHWSHLDPESRALSEQLEPMEIESASHYLLTVSQPHDYLEPPENVTPLPEAPEAREAALEEKVRRGQIAFQERGCLACHSHPDFPEMNEYREPGSIQQGPDLGGIGSKFAPERNPNGRKWLYSWIKEPTRYHARTVMPNLYLDPMEIQVGEGDNPETMIIDPADDIVEYLMTSTKEDWDPVAGPDFSDPANVEALNDLVRTHLADAFITRDAETYLKYGVPERRRQDLKVAEKALVVSDQDFDNKVPLSLDLKLMYAGTKTIGKFGCYGCHDIPGFEEAKPIGAGLADWGRKDPNTLAFEHIHEYLHQHGDGHGLTREEAADLVGNPYLDGEPNGAGNGHAGEEHSEDAHSGDAAADLHGVMSPGHGQYPDYYMSQLNSGNRTGFIYQKLREPRSYDYMKTRNKKYNERLRMPLFPFDDGEREAVITFVLGLVADPPNEKYMYQPDERQEALIEGKQVLDKFNCKGCHMLEPQLWELEFPGGAITPQAADFTKLFPFVVPDYTAQDVEQSKALNHRNRVSAMVQGMHHIQDKGFLRILYDGDMIEDDEVYDPRQLTYTFDIWKPALIDGNLYMPGETRKSIDGSYIRQRRPAEGGDLARYLILRVGARALEENPNTDVKNVWGWLPPPLHHEGVKVQTDWLHDFLLEPHVIRPAAVLRMPKFNMSPQEATKLVNYFAAKENVRYPYSYSERRDPERLEQLDELYREQTGGGEPGKRLRHAMQIVTSQIYCIKCHNVADAQTTAALRAQAPNLAEVYRRLRPQYLREWLANPKSILPYTGMPNNVAYDPDAPYLGTQVPQDLYHGDAVQQIDALVDLLMNYDQYARNQTKIAPLVAEAIERDKANAAAGQPNATTPGSDSTDDAPGPDAPTNPPAGTPPAGTPPAGTPPGDPETPPASPAPTAAEEPVDGGDESPGEPAAATPPTAPRDN